MEQNYLINVEFLETVLLVINAFLLGFVALYLSGFHFIIIFSQKLTKLPIIASSFIKSLSENT